MTCDGKNSVLDERVTKGSQQPLGDHARPQMGKRGDAKPPRLPKQGYAAWRSSRYSS